MSDIYVNLSFGPHQTGQRANYVIAVYYIPIPMHYIKCPMTIVN